MIFQDSLFVLFFFIVFICYWLLGHKQQNVFLLVVSYAFYGYIDLKFLLLLTFQSIITFYLVAIFVKLSKTNKKLIFTLAILFNIIVLGYFKYYNFFTENINSLFNSFGIGTSLPVLHIIFPLGISFYTFQNISYIVDVKKKVVKPCESIIDYCLYIGFFPKLIAGPIERASNLLHQIYEERNIKFDQLVLGASFFLWGCFQKVVIADNLVMVSNKVFLLENPDFFLLSAGAFSYTMQIFADFSGYTDMARGLALLLGFKLMANFNNPYFSRNPADFWRRWHISFSEWIRDYIYIPLGGSRVSKIRWAVNLFVAFFFTGLWHGASWNYIIWGLYYWALYLVYRLWGTICPEGIYNMKYNYIFSIFIMFIFTNIGWVIFRETNLQYLWQYISVGFFNFNSKNFFPSVYLFLYVLSYSFPIIAFSTISFVFCSSDRNKIITSRKLQTVGVLLLFILVIMLHNPEGSQFIYFNF